MKTGRPWKITTPPPVQGVTITADDQIDLQLEIPPILPREEIGQLIREDLQGRRYEEGEDGTLTKERGDGVKITINPESGDVHISVEATEDLPPPPDNPSPCGCRIQNALREQEARRENRTRGLQQEVTGRLERALPKVGCELEGLAARIAKEAVKIKAGRLGEVKEMTEDDHGGITIVVEV